MNTIFFIFSRNTSTAIISFNLNVKASQSLCSSITVSLYINKDKLHFLSLKNVLILRKVQQINGRLNI